MVILYYRVAAPKLARPRALVLSKTILPSPWQLTYSRSSGRVRTARTRTSVPEPGGNENSVVCQRGSWKGGSDPRWGGQSRQRGLIDGERCVSGATVMR